MQEGRDWIDEERLAQVSGLVKSERERERERERESGASLGANEGAWVRERESHIQSLKIGEGAHVGNRSSEEVVAQDPASH